MKLLLLMISCSILQNLQAQQVVQYYDHSWKKTSPNYAAFASVWDKKNDIWERTDLFIGNKQKQMHGFYTDTINGKEQGLFHYFYANGSLESKGSYANGKKNGLWLNFWPNGFMKDSINYIEDQPIGIYKSWYSDGGISDSVNHYNDSMAVVVQWFKNGSPAAAGRILKGKRHGSWVYYHSNSQKSAVEKYQLGQRIDSTYFNEEGAAVLASQAEKGAEFPGGISAWQKYLLSKLYSPPNVNLVNTDKIVVVVMFTVNENGEVGDAVVKVPFHPAYDDIALKTIKKSPKWIPAIQKNRKVPYYHTQSVSFRQLED